MSSRSFERLELTDNSDLKIPETSTLLCYGGGFFGRGIAIGNNNSSIPGSLRYNNQSLQLRHTNNWVNIKGFVYSSDRYNSLIKLNEDNVLENTNIILTDENMSGLNSIETNILHSPDNFPLYINNTQWPLQIGKEGNTLVYSETGVLSVDEKAITYHTDILPLAEDYSGKKGTLHFDDTHLYVCVGEDKWKRILLETIP